MTTPHTRAEQERAKRERRRLASLEAAIRKHYDNPHGRRILATRGLALPPSHDEQGAAA